MDAVLAKPGIILEAEFCRRNTAIQAVVVYCGFEEGGMRFFRPKKPSTRAARSGEREVLQQDTAEADLEAAKVAVYKEKRPIICFMCLGEQRIETFHLLTDLSKHFKRRHLSNVKEGERPECRLCQIPLNDVTHLQRYIYDVHGTVSLQFRA